MPEHTPDSEDATFPMYALGDADRLSDLSEDHPVFITREGRISKVLMNIDLYNRIEGILFDLDLQKRCRLAKTDGRNVDAVEFIEGLLEDSKQGKSIRILNPGSR